MKTKIFQLLGLAAVLLLTACNMPGGNSAEQVQTQAAETVNAQLTQNALLTPSSTNTPLPTATLAATNTPAVTNTPPATSASGGATGGCDVMAFVSDVTVPDGEEFAPSEAFVKTWRLRNGGSCTWSTSYSVVFVSGNAMGGTATQALTASIVPGSTLDVSVNMTAPTTAGDYTGYWALRNATGQNFGSFYVQIEVTGSGGSGSGDSDENLSANLVGQVRSDGTTGTSAQVGDNNTNVSIQGFVSFDISDIPDDATIEEVQVDFTDFDTDSNPFAALGCLTANFGGYFPLDAGDYSASSSAVDAEWCDANELSTVFIIDEVADRLQSVLGTQDTLEYRFRFATPTDSDGASDLVRFLSMNLIVTYSEP
jgi:hypothetical protein